MTPSNLPAQEGPAMSESLLDPAGKVNLLAETEDAIADSGHTPDDIIFIGSRKTGHQCTWDEFTRLADVMYDDSFGAQKVASDLEIVFSDGATMWRHEYDGSENWTFSPPFTMPADSKPLARLVVDDATEVGWCTLAELNTPAPREE